MSAKKKNRFAPRGRSRSFNSRSEKYYFLIITNGESTEYNYFKDFGASMPKGSVCVEPRFENNSPKNLIQKADKLAAKPNSSGIIPDEVWAVFDKDEFPDFNQAVEMANRSHKISAAYSNESFELWLLLHFQEVTSALGRKTCETKLLEHLAKAIDRKSKIDLKSKQTPIFEWLQQYGDELSAIKRAEKMNSKDKKTPWKENPSTNVHKLIKQIRGKCFNG